MKQCKHLSKSLFSKVTVSVMLVMAISAVMGGSLTVAADSPAPETEWEKTFGGTFSDYGTSVQQTTDGGYIIAGNTNSCGAGLYDVYLIKTDANGDMEWEKTIGGIYNDYVYSIKQTSDGGYIMTGCTESYGAGSRDFYLIKAYANGDMEWQSTFGGIYSDCAYSVQQTTDGGYIMTGYTDSYGAGSRDVYLVKTYANGDMEWEKTFGGSEWDDAYYTQQTTDGGYIVAGLTDSYGVGYEDFYLVKTYANGDMEWEKTFGGSEWDDAFSAQQTTDGGYIVAGLTDSYGAGFYDVYLVKTDANGDMEWQNTFGGSADDFAESIQQTTDGGYIVAGLTESYGAGFYDVYLVKTDANGDMEWEKTFGGSADDFAESIQQTTDGGYIVAGLTDSYGAGSYDVYFVKVESWINTPAGEDVTVNLESGTVNFPTVSENGTTTMTTLTENPADPTPADFYVMGENFVEITTTASYSGVITVGIMYDDSGISDEESLRLFHWDGSEWVDATTDVDTVNNIIYGEVDSLSPFFIGIPLTLPVADAGGPYLTQVGYELLLNGVGSYHPDYPDRTIESYDWDFGDNTTGSSSVIIPHTYTAVGVYDVVLTVTDDIGVQGSDTTMAVVYDPETGSATGGGWFWSAPGKLKSDPESEGKATFGFVVKYKKGEPDGNLEFQYHVGDINLKSIEIAWLVVSDVSAQFQGEGTINGEGLYTFRVQAKDGDQVGGQPDEFSIKIWQGTDTEADPIYSANNVELGGGNIIIHD